MLPCAWSAIRPTFPSRRSGTMDTDQHMATLTDNKPQLTEADLSYQGEYQPHPPGIFPAQLDEVTVIAGAEQYGSKPRLCMSFVTNESMDNGEPFSINVYSAPSLDARASLRGFLLAIGQDLAVIKESMAAGTYRTGNFIGSKCLLVIEHEPRADGQGIRAKVKSFQPLKAKAPRVKPNFDVNEA